MHSSTPVARSLGTRVLLLLGASLLVLLGVLIPSASASAAVSRPAADPANVQVFVGYADNLRANPTNFPTPWSSSSDVIFAGCTVNCTFDAGAARFVNNTSLPVTISSVAIKFDTCTFAMWPNTTLNPNQQLIVTQTASGAAAGCSNTAGFFDTSDIGPNNSSWVGHCTNSGVVPEIDATIDGVPNTFTDAGQVLNTGGIDLASCPNGTNESEQWTSIGSAPCPGATLSLAPPSQNVPVGSPATVTATLQNSCGTGLQGAPITFTVPSGPNAGTTGTVTTDVNGQANFTYTGAVPGTDTVVATTTNPAGTITSNTVNVVWQKAASQLAITGGASTSDFNDAATVAGVLTDAHGPLANEPVTFTLNGTETCTGTTNASGAASCSLTPGEAAGGYPLTATFAGDATHDGTSATATFTVTHEETTLTYTGPTKAANGTPLTLSGVLQEDGTTPINGRTVTFTIGSGASAQSCTGTTGTNGSASCTIASVNQGAGATSVPVSAVFAGDGFYLPASASATLKFLFMTGRAFGLSSSGLVGISPTPDTGPVATSVASTVAPPCVLSIGGLITAHTLCAKVTTSVNPGASAASASVQDATIGVLGIPTIKIGLVQSASNTTCAGSSGNATVTSISVAGVPLNIDLHPAPNTTINVAGITLVLNEQIPVAGADQGLTVNAVHVKALGLLDVVLASSTSDIHNC